MRRNINLPTYLLLGIPALVLIALAGDLAASISPMANIVVPREGMWRGGMVPRAQAESLSVYLPLVLRSYPAPSIFGIQMDAISDSGGLSQVAQTRTRWVHGPGVLWSAVESSPGVRDWSVLSSLEQELLNASNTGLVPIVSVRSTPIWARKVTDHSCSAITESHLGAFANFMRDLVARYSVPPYGVKYWEIWNEPDVDPSLVTPDSWFGCWGDKDDVYYGGGHYAKMLQAVYPQIKAADQQAQVLVGGLLLDCDPQSGCSAVHHDPLPAKFLEGILIGGGAPFFDGVSYHAYDYYTGSGQYSNGNWGSAWNTTGPVLMAKSYFVSQSLLNQGVTGKFLINSEAGLVCTTGCDVVFENTKAYYLVQDYAIAIALGLRANVWYSLYGESGTGLLDTGGTPLPAYYAYQFASRELAGAVYTRAITEYPSVKGYEFNRGDRVIWVVWSADGSSHSVTPSRGVPLAAWDALGNTMAPASPISVGTPPLYLEWTP